MAKMNAVSTDCPWLAVMTDQKWPTVSPKAIASRMTTSVAPSGGRMMARPEITAARRTAQTSSRIRASGVDVVDHKVGVFQISKEAQIEENTANKQRLARPVLPLGHKHHAADT